MIQPNLSTRKTSLITVWTSVLLAICCIIASFTSMITLKTGESFEEINDILEVSQEDSDFQIPETVEVSVPKLISSVKIIKTVVETVKEGSSAQEAGNEAKSEEAAEELVELFKSDKGKETIVMIIALVNTAVGSLGANMSGGLLGGIFSGVISFFALIYVLIFTLVIPIIYCLVGLGMLVRALKNYKNPEVVANKIGGKLPSLIYIPMLFLLFETLIPGMSFGSGALMIWIFSLLSVLVGATTARLRKYREKDFIYSIIVQATSLFAMIGFVVFFINILKTNIIQNFLADGWSEVQLGIAEGRSAATQNNHKLQIPKGHIISAIFMLITVCLILGSLGDIFSSYAGRVALSAKDRRKKKVSDSSIISVVILLLVYILPTYMMRKTYDYSDIAPFIEITSVATGAGIVDASKITFLNLSTAEMGALTGALIGIIIMLIGEVALIILKKCFCESITKEEMVAVLKGEASIAEVKKDETNETQIDKVSQEKKETEKTGIN